MLLPKISRADVSKLMAIGTQWLCTTAIKGDGYHINAGLRTVELTSNTRIHMQCGLGSPHVGAKTQLLFETGDKQYTNEQGTIIEIVSQDVTIRYQKQ